MSCEQCQSDEEEFENSADIQKVKKGGIYTIGGVLTNTKKQLCTIKGISEAKVDKLKGNGFLTALEYGEKRRRVFKISTGSNELEERCILINLGLTQFEKIYKLCVEAIHRPDRLRTIANRFDLDENEVLTNIAYRRVYNSEHLATSIIEAAGEFYEERKIYKLLIIDSLTHPFRTDFCGRGELADRQQKLGQVLSKLQKVAEDGFGSGRPDRAENEAMFAITEGGVADAKE
ncbi:uncharacterized protein TRIADDRAFT_52181 [Trichoplax adhaerens]|uniref:Rad51-like C-terminal domain-containing protein n=1 Tax=Trichoplax adhaerens TaxID=10228 RepID=B3RLZ8_TRIAD|nr:hypothetical protein TRIADDRAFT_52181 [Trichoplax adhaerens]EDV28874.1 hypothetical protein TRIADDRAFT_52181 [Trichoplax adhaerens]|eukprot:XP_002108076.1 hypothetical protein TRIADDRAFT_52181 [Trichoplax adhaerens]